MTECNATDLLHKISAYALFQYRSFALNGQDIIILNRFIQS